MDIKKEFEEKLVLPYSEGEWNAYGEQSNKVWQFIEEKLKGERIKAIDECIAVCQKEMVLQTGNGAIFKPHYEHALSIKKQLQQLKEVSDDH